MESLQRKCSPPYGATLPLLIYRWNFNEKWRIESWAFPKIIITVTLSKDEMRAEMGKFWKVPLQKTRLLTLWKHYHFLLFQRTWIVFSVANAPMRAKLRVFILRSTSWLFTTVGGLCLSLERRCVLGAQPEPWINMSKVHKLSVLPST